MTLYSCTAATFGTGWRDHIKEHILLLDVCLLGLAALPTVSPITDKKLEAEGVNLHAWLKADTEVAIVHLVLFGVREEE